jgi:hypothetical protein
MSAFLGSVWFALLLGCVGFAAGWVVKGKYGHRL